MKLDAGRYRHIVTIETPTGDTDELGNVRQAWRALYTNIPAEIAPVSSKEQYAGQQIKSQGTHRIYMRFAPDVTSQCRVIYGDRTFTITGVINAEERNIMLELYCQEQVQ